MCVTVHDRGLGNSSFTVDFASFPDTRNVNHTDSVKQFHSLPEVIDLLGHRGRTLTLLKMDVEGAEVGCCCNCL